MLVLPAVFLLAALNTAPAPSPAPLKTIIHLRASALCSTVSETVPKIMSNMMEDQEIVDVSEPVVLHLGGFEIGDYYNGAHDEFKKMYFSGAQLKIAESQLERLINHFQRNIKVIDDLLGDPRVFPKSGTGADDDMLKELHAKLEAVAAEQRSQLNLLSGLLATEQLGRTHGEGYSMFDETMPEADSFDQAAMAKGGSQLGGGAGLPPTPADGTDPVQNQLQTQVGKNNVYGEAVIRLRQSQQRAVPFANDMSAYVQTAYQSCIHSSR